MPLKNSTRKSQEDLLECRGSCGSGGGVQSCWGDVQSCCRLSLAQKAMPNAKERSIDFRLINSQDPED